MPLEEAGWRAACRAGAGLGSLTSRARAAMLGKVSEQAIHLGEIRAVDQIPALLLDADQGCVRKLLQVERQRVAGNAKPFGHDTWCKAVGPRDDKRTKHAQALGMGQGIQGSNGLIFIHQSIIQQLLNYLCMQARRGPK